MSARTTTRTGPKPKLPKTAVGRVLFTELSARNLSTSEFARVSGMSRVTLSVLSRRGAPTLTTLRAIAKGLEISPSDLVSKIEAEEKK